MADSIGLKAVLDISQFTKDAKTYESILGDLEKQTADFVKGIGSETITLPDIEPPDMPELPELPTGLGLPGATGLGAAAATGIGAIAVAGAASVAAIAATGAEVLSLSQDVDAATNQMQAALGLTEEQADAFAESAKNLFGDALTGSVQEAADAIIVAQQQLGKIDGANVEDATKAALKLEKVFGVDMEQSLNATRTLMDEFGLSQEDAFNFIAKGFQEGLNSSDDFLDSITEYSNLFGQSGADAGEFFSVLETGLAGGVLGTDKAADLFKEFSVRIVDSSNATADTLKKLQGPNEDLLQQISDGSLTVADAFTMIKDRIADIDDPVKQAAYGVALFGTQWEDLGTQAVLGINTTQTSLNDLDGAINDVLNKPRSIGESFDAIGNEILLALEPIGGTLLDIFNNNVLPAIQQLAEQVTPYIQDFAAGITPILANFSDELFPRLADAALQIGEDFNRIAEAFGYSSENGGGLQVAIDLITGSLDLILGAIEPVVNLFDDLSTILVAAKSASDAINRAMQPLYDTIQKVADALWDAVGAADEFGQLDFNMSTGSMVGNTLGAITGVGTIANGLNLLGFATGGIVPGPVGAPQLAVVHGGETVIPANQSAGANVNINMNGMQFNTSGGDVDSALQEAFGMIRQQIANKMR